MTVLLPDVAEAGRRVAKPSGAARRRVESRSPQILGMLESSSCAASLKPGYVTARNSFHSKRS